MSTAVRMPHFLRRRGREAPAEAAAPAAPRELPAQLLKRLEFRVLRRLDGFLFGDYSGLFHGPSLDLAEVREYQPGDEVRRIDWNVTARSGVLHIRQYREEREIQAWLIVDLSPSMAFGTRRTLKRDGAIAFAGLAAAIIARHGDKVGALGFSATGARFTPLGSGRRQALTILDDLGSLGRGRAERGARAVTDLERALAHADRLLKRRALVLVVSDFLTADGASDPGAAPGWGRALGRLAQRHETIAVRITDPAEHVLPAVGDLRLRDPESGQEVWVDSSDPRVRQAHAQLVAQRERTLARTLRKAQVELLELSTARDVVGPILRFTQRRRGRQR